MEYFLVFPLSSLICQGVEAGVKKMLPNRLNDNSFKTFSAFTGYNGLAPASFILTSLLAVTIMDGITLAVFFSLGCLLVSAITAEIARRSFLEKVPSSIRGNPLRLISMGLLSMVFAFAAGICLRLFEKL